MNEKFWQYLVCARCSIYITRAKQFKTWLVPVELHSIVIASALTFCRLLHLEYDLKAAVQYSLIRELMLYGFKLGHNTAEATKKHLLWKR